MIPRVLSWGRRQAEARFTETFTFFTATDGEPDPVTFEPTVTETVIAAGVAGRLKFSSTQGNDVESASQYPVESRPEVHVAVGAVEAPVGTLVRVTASTVDESLVGRVMRIADLPQAGQTTAHRFPATEVS